VERKALGRILLAVDGEPHTADAVRWALDLAVHLGLEVGAVHVRDPYLKQFSNEIYAQGREEYLAHVQDCLEATTRRTSAEFEDAVREYVEGMDHQSDLSWSFDVLDGEPANELLKLLERGGISMVVLGRRRPRRGALRSRDLAERLALAGCTVPVLVVPGAAACR
jgi:nucleotide-binding universal stress UspA family protein